MAGIRWLIIPLLPVLAAVVFYRLDTFDPAPFPDAELVRNRPPFAAPNINPRMLLGADKIGYGDLHAPEDIALDPITGVIYTGCDDGWVSRIIPGRSAADTKVEKWVNTGGRPLGIAHGVHREIIVADADKGLLNITRDGVIELLTDEADGLKFQLTDAVDVGPDGKLYFTDASSKHGYWDSIIDILEGRPNGRFLSYDPATRQTRVLLKDLYFANGVTVSADRSSVIFCETGALRCKKYYIEGPRKGSVEMFIDNLPGMPDNIRYDGEGQYWIAISSESKVWQVMQAYPRIRKVAGMLEKYKIRPSTEKHGGAVAVDLDGKPIAHYHDRDMAMISSGIKIGDHLFIGSIVYPYVIRLNLSEYPATPLH